MSTPPAAVSGVAGTWLADALPWLSTGHGPWEASSSLRVGVDLVSVADMAESVERFGDRYVYRIFTPHEVACCRSDLPSGRSCPGYSFESMAARFAAKEATVKVLRPVGPRPEWRSIEVHRAAGGWCEIRLSGRAATMAAEVGIDDLAVSLTHEASMAAAVVVGMCRDGNRTAARGTPSDRREE
jgi:holo-[acyl-carrier protein] synthase